MNILYAKKINILSSNRDNNILHVDDLLAFVFLQFIFIIYLYIYLLNNH